MLFGCKIKFPFKVKYQIQDSERLSILLLIVTRIIQILDAELIAANIELTRFPVPQDDDHRDTTGFPGLVRKTESIAIL